jgi:hypothetical protein
MSSSGNSEGLERGSGNMDSINEPTMQIQPMSDKIALIPAFHPERVANWFTLLETQFEDNQVVSPRMKFSIAARFTPAEYMPDLESIMEGGTDPYESYKSKLLNKDRPSMRKMVAEAFHHVFMGDTAPKKWYRDLKDLLLPDLYAFFHEPQQTGMLKELLIKDVEQPTQINLRLHCQERSVRELVDELQRLYEEDSLPIRRPPRISQISGGLATKISGGLAAPTEAVPAGYLASMKMMQDAITNLTVHMTEYFRESQKTSAEILKLLKENKPGRGPEAAPERRPRSRSRPRYVPGPLCFYHTTHGDKAYRCEPPCQWQGAPPTAAPRQPQGPPAVQQLYYGQQPSQLAYPMSNMHLDHSSYQSRGRPYYTTENSTPAGGAAWPTIEPPPPAANHGRTIGEEPRSLGFH